MIVKCQGTAPDGTFGCSRAMGHDDHEQPCKSHQADVVWCSRCDQWDCEHVPALDYEISVIQRKVIADARAKYLVQQEKILAQQEALVSAMTQPFSNTKESNSNNTTPPRSRRWWSKLFRGE